MSLEPVYIVDGARSPFLKARKGPGPFTAADLAVQVGRELLLRQPAAGGNLDEVIIGCAAPSADETNIGRLIALRLQCGPHVPGWTVSRNCASGMQAIDSALMSIQCGRADIVLAGGTEALSHTPMLVSDEMRRWFADWQTESDTRARLTALKELRPRYLTPQPALVKGLTDPTTGLSMGQTAENLAHLFNISRHDMDMYAHRSHERAHAATSQLISTEIVPIVDAYGRMHIQDEGIRPDSSITALAQLRPAFDPPWGNITAGNSSQVSDGAALLLLASARAVQQHQLEPIGRIVDIQWAALDPAMMGLGPVMAATPLLERHQYGLNDIDLWEINEAFAAQVLGCLAAWEDEHWCQTHLGRSALGRLDESRLNVEGGAIAIGHPVGASGARLPLHLLHALRARGLRRGIATLCIGGGQGGAMLLETAEELGS